MKRSGKIKWAKLRVGIIVVFAIMALLYSSFRGGGTSIFEGKDQVIIYFKNVNGLVRGAPVWLGGIEVGNVKSVKFVNIDENRIIEGKISVKRSVWEFLTMDTKARLGTIGLLGDKYVELIPGTKGLPTIEPGAVIPLEEQTGLDAMARKAPGMVESVDSLLSNIQDISGKIAGGEGTAGKLVNDTVLYSNLIKAIDDISIVMVNIQKRQNIILDKLASTADNANQITGQIASGEGSIGKLIHDEKFYNNLANSSGRLDSIIAKIDRGEGSAGALINDAELYEEIRNLVVRINNLVADIEENPGRYFKFSVF